MTATAAPRAGRAAPAGASRRLERTPGRGPLLGVAAAIADHTGIPAKWVRVAFVLLASAAGLGTALYGAYFIVLPTAPGATRSRVRTAFEAVVAVVVAVSAVVVAGQALPAGSFMTPLLLALLGGALIWRQASESDRTRLRTLSRRSMTLSGPGVGRVRVVVGAAFVVAAGALVLRRADVTAVRDGLIATLVALVGVAMITGPWWMRLVTQLSVEREARIRSQERADIAAHLHDSVLQTLALIQRNANSPREVARLARGQERELRTLLYSAPQASGLLATQLRAVAAEVEDAYAIGVDTVVVGDATVDTGTAAVVAAAREALVNAAKHAGVETVSLFAEVEDGEVAVFVKDRGAGFVLEEVADDRQGVRGSIVGRVERHGGRVTIRSTPGEGTEVQIHMPLHQGDA